MEDRHREWLERWERGETGWHLDEPHPDLVAHHGRDWRRVLVPLCGASADLGWLAGQGKEVVGVELSPLAVSRVFAELGHEPDMVQAGPYVRYQADAVTVLQGDVFALEPAAAGTFEAVWDRAALVALSPHLLAAYAEAIGRVAAGAELLLSVFEGPDPAGPPFAVAEGVVRSLYDDVDLLAEQDMTAMFAERGRRGPVVQRLYRARIR